ncbi:MAG: creatininase family protein, partial [Comamonas sp.]|nr:creatininase family protein [Comamonas sp.]
ARQLRQQQGLLVYHSSWFNLPLPQALDAAFSPQEHRFGIHGGEVETAMMLHLASELVDMQQARDFPSTSAQRARDYPILGNGKSAKLGWAIQDYHPAGAVGNAAAADAQRGAALVQAAGGVLAQLLQEIHRLPADTVGAKY